ncbi:MAG: GntR family transcriptional regulator [Clostridia bacterium]|nr:GntR family transcriptional regulator [Clostridia bacterium]
MMLEHRNYTLADQVFERLETEILSGQYPRGELLTELKLCQALGVSRTPVREALHRLQQEHIVEETGKGFKVLGITREDLADIMEMRLRLESFAAARAAERITEEQLKQLEDTLDLQEFYLTKRDSDHIKQMDSKFHELVYKFSGSAVIYDTLTPLHKKVQRYRQKSVENKSRAEESVHEHRAIYEAIAAHDPKKAAEAILKHTQNAKNHISKGQ